ncbi:NAD(P)-dependent dehydrogenase (short-subunit alcohol dehydrogenase family) [Kribbella amoyensis]|uniref:NAD(P)-dependent dehydrogenase (Short-subunit alcohol dehydrogenase family) n=1 Tax=Kribbella amoyensis TaxID=996641 RepID=A0A561BNI1_9ACTN|nr:SDR family NAD(P)-dependent oxidoreductase [Kribbella amoyensis]TWD80362.1 NAD(P)-dependent dehydrogenase (short-subunit alcohol dehydrogenase family) [Kribbella amoyensis]
MKSLVWISGASAGIGAALAAAIPAEDTRIIGISRRPTPAGSSVEHFAADLADPAEWARVERHFGEALAGFAGERVVFVHNAGTIVPIGPADQVDSAEYARAILLNSAAPQVLGAAFLRATAGLDCEKHLILLSSGAAKNPYPGWSAYNGGKAAVEQWVRTVGAEPNGCRVLSVAPGVVDTAMQAEIRKVDERAFPAVERFRDLDRSGRLVSPGQAARGLWSLLDRDLDSGSTIDLRDF